MTEADQIPPNDVGRVRTLLELVFEQLDMGVGPWRLEADAQDGRVSVIWRHNKIRGTDLDEWPARRAPEAPEL